MPRDRYVWRVENDAGEGPYNAEGAPLDLYFRLRGLPQSQAPGFGRDFRRTDRARLDREEDFYRFGFEERAQAVAWFGRELLAELRRHGFTLRRVSAARVWRSRSGRQVMFEPARSERRAA